MHFYVCHICHSICFLQFSVTLNLQAIYTEHFGKPIENDSDEVEERAENFPRTSEIPIFLGTPEAVKASESLEKIKFPKTPPFEMQDFN